MNTLVSARSAFLQYLRHEGGLAENTLAAYGRDLDRLLRWCEDQRITAWERLSHQQLGNYLGFLASERLSPASVARHVASLKMFFRFLVLDGWLAESSAELLCRPGLWDRVPHVLSEKQLEALLTAPNKRNDALWVRDRAILETLAATGCRASEVAGLRLGQVHLEERFLRCVGKGNRERLVPFGERAQGILRAYIDEVRPALLRDREPTGLVFVSRAGRPLSRIDLWKIVKKYARRLGIADRVSVHTLRHTFATRLLAQGADLRVIQELLGHASIATTQIYTRVDASRLKDLHRRFHPRG